MSTDSVFNIAIIGKAGVGKSSVINYLFGANLTKSGVGMPVTSKGFHPVKAEMAGMPVVIYDSWGIETGKTEEWLTSLDEEVQKRGVDKPVSSWFHSVFYCFAGSRIDAEEISIIKKLVESHCKVSVLFTWADASSPEDLQKLEDALRKELAKAGIAQEKIAIIPVCSVEKKLMGGGGSRPFGKDKVERQALADLLDSLIERIPLHCEQAMKHTLKTEMGHLRKKLTESLGFAGHNALTVGEDLNTLALNLQQSVLLKGNAVLKEDVSHYAWIGNKLEGLLPNHAPKMKSKPFDMDSPEKLLADVIKSVGSTLSPKKIWEKSSVWEKVLLVAVAPVVAIPAIEVSLISSVVAAGGVAMTGKAVAKTAFDDAMQRLEKEVDGHIRQRSIAIKQSLAAIRNELQEEVAA